MATDSPVEVPSLHPVLVSQELLAELVAGRDEVLDLREAAAYLKVSQEDVLRMVREQGLPARQVGEGWRFLKAATREWLRTGTGAPTQQSSREALLAMAGSFRDDPDLELIVEEAMRLRGRQPTEGE